MLMYPDLGRHHAKDTKLLRSLAQSTQRSLEALEALSKNTLEALNYQPAALRKLKTHLRILHAVVEAEVNSPARPPARRGPKPKLRPRKIAVAVADHFFGLTGKPPNRTKLSSGFLCFLGEIFKALGVVASAEVYGKEAIRLWTNKRRTKPK